MAKKKARRAVSAVKVRVGTLPGMIRDYNLEPDHCTVADALNAADIDPSGFDLRVNSEPADFEDELENGDNVLLVKNVKAA